jgi:hypothetical protein
LRFAIAYETYLMATTKKSPDKAKKAASKSSPKKRQKKAGKNKPVVKNSLVNNINARKKKGTSKGKKKPAISKKAFGDMKNNWAKTSK